MKIGFITTSRADFGIYLPLLRAVDKEPHMELFIFVGGMHLKEQFGNTYQIIEENGFKITSSVDSLEDGDFPIDIANSMGNTVKGFSSIWEEFAKPLDLIFVLGDRYEMFAAAISILPFNKKIAHLHGGEESQGAIDHKFRNAISTISDFHFASTDRHKNRVSEIVGYSDHVYNVGALGIEAIASTELYNREEFITKYGLDGNDFVLVTFHPETIHDDNQQRIEAFINALKEIPFQILCTLPNADQQGNLIRKALLDFQEEVGLQKILCYENLGLKGYYSAMNYCEIMIGNSSSGIIEAAYVDKYVINVGDRQKGRESGNNVIHVECNTEKILEVYANISKLAPINIANPYGKGNSSEEIISILKREFE